MKEHRCLRPLFLCHRCLIKDFEKRPSVTHLLEHPFIKQVHGKDMSLQKQLAELIQEQQQLGSVAKTRYRTTYMLQPSLPTLVLEAQFETSNAQALTSNIISNKCCVPCECKRHIFPLILCKGDLISHYATFSLAFFLPLNSVLYVFAFGSVTEMLVIPKCSGLCKYILSW